MLLDSEGKPVIMDAVYGLLREREALFAGAMTAISRMINEIMKTRIKYMRMENLHLYLGSLEGIILVVISDSEDPHVGQLIDSALEKILRIVDDPTKIVLDPKIREYVGGVLREIMSEFPPSLTELIRIADRIIAFADSIRRGGTLDLGDIIPPPKKLERIEIKAVKPSKRMSIDELLKNLLSGNLRSIIGIDPHTMESDYDRAILAKTLLIANSSFLQIKTVSLDYVYSVIMSIRDDTIRSLLLSELRRYLDFGTYYEKEDVIRDNLNEILEKLKAADSQVRLIYTILTIPTQSKEISEAVSNIDLSSFPYTRFKFIEGIPHLKASILKIRDLSELNTVIGNIKYMLSRKLTDLSEAFFVHTLALQFALLQTLTTEDIDVDMGYKFIRETIGYMDRVYETIRKAPKVVSNEVLATNYWLTYNALLNILIALLPTENLGKIAEKYGAKLVDLIRWLLETAKKRRIALDIYAISMIGILTAYSRIMFLLRTPIVDLPRYLKQLLNNGLVKIGKYAPYHLLHAIVNGFEALGYLASFIPLDAARKNILMEIGSNLEKIYRSSGFLTIVAIFAGLSAIKFYSLCGTEQGKKRARSLAVEISKRNELLSKIAERFLEIDRIAKATQAPHDIFL